MAALTMPVAKTKNVQVQTNNWLSISDEIELNRRLKISIAQADRGELRPARVALNEIRERVLGVY